MELSKNRLVVYHNKDQLPTGFTASRLGLTDKADHSKRWIHHLSYPTSNSNSINGGIPDNYGTIPYSGTGVAIQGIQAMGRDSLLVKRDFDSALSHIPVSPMDSPLLGFHCEATCYRDSFLPFGLRIAAYLFNLCAEVFHWILEEKLKQKGLRGSVKHYLDYFLMILPLHSIATTYTTGFADLCPKVSLCIKESTMKKER